ncbi:putative exonuclease containing RNaseH-like domain [Methanonatronarchaeum thermophilum]|uniref:Putative exonuclease containing RNaseH-like domain n=1 Tax=Methanonatronarchaeum thermophilum TaxID=1927129 RepID=A0A1Y3GD73_9EURY|nr:ribonuclease H-like domain-containing protein [Methanonatronarchaeum thermophilum]OUJ19187.1 putative exonuclease containing RNaseH-like domain [Methanonatronarchaeum thermophilum]
MLNNWTKHINPETANKNPKHIKQKLIQKYKNTTITQLPNTKKIHNQNGSYIKRSEKIKQTIKPQKTTTKKHTNLKAIPGIGPKTETKLKKQGYKTITQLKKHPKWSHKCQNHLKQLTTPATTIKTLHQKINPTCLEALKHTPKLKNKEIALLDIETLGLHNQPIILIGIGHPQKNHLKLNQLLIENPKQEKTVLQQTKKQLQNKTTIITFNGKTFDIPYIQKRQKHHNITPTKNKTHIDLYHYTKKTHNLPKNKLNHIEKKLLNIQRKIDIPSSQVPKYYQTYLEKQNPGPLLPILSHNRQDILTLTNLYHKITEKTLNPS